MFSNRTIKSNQCKDLICYITFNFSSYYSFHFVGKVKSYNLITVLKINGKYNVQYTCKHKCKFNWNSFMTYCALLVNTTI